MLFRILARNRPPLIPIATALSASILNFVVVLYAPIRRAA